MCLENLEPVGHYSSCWLEGNDQHSTVLVKSDNYTATFGSQAIVEYLLQRYVNASFFNS